MPSKDRQSLVQAVDSVIKQSYQNWELLIMGNGNPPDYQKDPRITYFVHDTATAKLNLLTELSTGDILNFCADDDTFTEHALSLVAKNFTSDWLVGRIFTSQGKVIGSPCTFEDLLVCNRLPCPAVYWTKEVAGKVGFWKRILVSDYDYWLRIWKDFGPPVFIEDVLSNYNIHPDQDSSLYYGQIALEALHVIKLHSVQNS